MGLTLADTSLLLRPHPLRDAKPCAAIAGLLGEGGMARLLLA